MKIYLYFIGKPKDPHANAIAADFVGRAARYSPCEMREIRPERVDLWDKHPSARKIFLDPAGKPMDSAGFARVIAKAEMEGRDLVFLIGGHDGLPAGWAARADQLVSLSADDVSARTGARHAGRADLSRLRDAARASVPKVRGIAGSICSSVPSRVNVGLACLGSSGTKGTTTNSPN